METHIRREWFDLILSGKKKYEGRVFDGKRPEYRVGEMLRVNTQNGFADFTITELVRADSFLELFEKVGLENILPGISTPEEGLRVYRECGISEDREREFGVVGIGLE
uniref:ASC-1 like domain protein n=1 Tax=Marseillevirus LCMAC101 TaxID=2506602 RepID=A0A481YUC1_9VIRU|nr:MAG: ASC-1 like domain protein [Marseillevirus LCMAC101]